MKTASARFLPGPEQWAFWKNPILVKEVRTRMRGNRAFLLLTAHLLFLALVLLLVFLVIRSSLNANANLQARESFGKAIFGLMVWLELVMVSFTAPALTSGAIALERDRQTLDLLKVTLLKARSLVVGKYLAGLVFVFLLLVTSLPMFSPAFILGGVLLNEILIAVLILATSAIAFCAVGLFFSSLFSRPLVATALAYAFSIFINFGIPMLMILAVTLFGWMLNSGPSTLADLHPFWLLAVVYLGWLVISLTPLATIIATEVALLDGQSAWLVKFPLGTGAEVLLVSPWLAYVTVYLLLSLALIWISVGLVRRVED
jgi:ABC-type transport system involved in multi-copper enzyme maturation permease subunit